MTLGKGIVGRCGYSAEFRRMVLDLAESGRSVADGACDLGISTETVYAWRRQAQVDAGHRPGTTIGHAHKIAEIERENRELKRANAILKSASAFFASGPQ